MNRWYAEIASTYANFVTVPIHTALDQAQIDHIVSNAELTVVVCSSDLLPKFFHSLAGFDGLRTLISMDPVSDEQMQEAAKHQVKLLILAEIEEEGRNNPRTTADADPADIHTIVYTSGSTGTPKGVVYTNLCWNNDLAIVRSKVPSWMGTGRDSRSAREIIAQSSHGRWFTNPLVGFSYAPLAHTMQRKHDLTTIASGGRIGFGRGEAVFLFDDMKALRPTVLAGAPRIWNMIYSSYQQALAQALRTRGDEDEVAVKARIRQEFRQITGGRTKMITTGGAPTSPDVMSFLISCFQCSIFESYGATEVGGITSDGILKQGVEVKLVDCPELGYRSSDKPFPRGELLVKTLNMCSGYYKDAEKTSETFDAQGWFHTGDVVQVDGHRYKVIDRIKNIFKLAQGEFVAPEPLEIIYLHSKFVDQVFIPPEITQSYLVAVVVLQPDTLREWLTAQGLDESQFDPNSSPALKQAVLHDFAQLASDKERQPFEFVKNVFFEREKWTPENGLLTGVMKLCRPALIARYHDAVGQLFAEQATDVSPPPLDDLLPLYHRIVEVMKSVLNLTEIDETDDFTSLGGDSMGAAQLAFRLQSELGLELRLALVLQGTPLLEVARRIEAESRGLTASTVLVEREIDWDQEMQLGPEYVLARKRHVLLTGCTGFLGEALLRSLLARQVYQKIYVLVRGRSLPDAKARMAELKSVDLAQHKDRIEVLRGDLGLLYMGLSQEDWTRLGSTLTDIVHNGAYVNAVQPYTVVKDANVKSTKSLLQLAFRAGAAFHYVSTVGVFGDRSRVQTEDRDLSTQQHYLPFMSGYEQSKWVAEQLLTEAAARGLAVKIFRPASIYADSQTGRGNEGDLIYRIIRGFVELKAYPLTDRDLDLTPVDWVAEAIIHLATNRTKETTFHLTNNRHVTVSQLGQWLASAGLELQPVGFFEWRKRLLASTQNPLFPLHHMFQGFDFPTSGRFDTRNTLAEFGEAPAVTEELVHKNLQWILKTQAEEAAKLKAKEKKPEEQKAKEKEKEKEKEKQENDKLSKSSEKDQDTEKKVKEPTKTEKSAKEGEAAPKEEKKGALDFLSFSWTKKDKRKEDEKKEEEKVEKKEQKTEQKKIEKPAAPEEGKPVEEKEREENKVPENGEELPKEEKAGLKDANGVPSPPSPQPPQKESEEERKGALDFLSFSWTKKKEEKKEEKSPEVQQNSNDQVKADDVKDSKARPDPEPPAPSPQEPKPKEKEEGMGDWTAELEHL